MKEVKRRLSNKIVFLIFLAILICFEVYAILIGNAYMWDTAVLIGLLVACLALEKILDLHPAHYALFGIFLILHNCGIFGWYDTYWLGIEFDTYVHFYFGLVSTLVISRTWDQWVPIKNNKLKYTSLIVIILGLSAFHELLEYVGGAFIGEGYGFLMAGAGDIEMWDTQTDMRNNLFGGLVGLLWIWIRYTVFSKTTVSLKEREKVSKKKGNNNRKRK
jgi:uncharacterized membrane protein YjdF